jgi:hypothetical protein
VEGKGGRYKEMGNGHIYENRRMKPVEIVLRRGKRGRGRMMERVNLIKIYCKHICRYHNVSLCTTIIC